MNQNANRGLWRALGAAASLGYLANVVAVAATAAEVALMRTPAGGIQPQAAVDAAGDIHLIYFKGPAEGGDVFYVREQAGAKGFCAPIRVNRQAGSVIAIGTIRGAHLALGKPGRAHVAWMGSQKAERAIIQGEREAPMLYTRLNDAGTGFEPERNLLTWAGELDGGGSVAADSQGNVYVAWHGSAPGNQLAEAGRAVFLARSSDEGKTFERERLANVQPTGACGCCGMRAFADGRGRVYLLYRAASAENDRGMALLRSTSPKEPLEVLRLDHWKLSTCPMSNAVFTEGGGGVLAAWEKENQVHYALVSPGSPALPPAISPPGTGQRRHPALARNTRGQTLLAWTEDTGWEKGGSLAWQVFDSAGRPTEQRGRQAGVPVWSLVAAVAKADNGFVIFY